MALFGLFGKEKSGPASSEFDEKGNKIQPNAQVNPEGGVDFVNNATVGASTTENAQIDPTVALEAKREAEAANEAAVQAKTMEALAASDQIVMNAHESNALHDQARQEVAVASAEQPAVSQSEVASDADAEAVAANVNQQLAGAGFEPSGQVVVQPEVAPVAAAEQAPAEPVALGTEQAANTAPEQPAQPGGEMPEAA